MAFNSKLYFFLVVITCNFGAFVKGDDPKAKQCYQCVWDFTGTSDCAENPSNFINCAGGYCYTYLNTKGVINRGCVGTDDDKIKTPEACTNLKYNCTLCYDQPKCNSHKIKEEQCYKATYTISDPIIMNDAHSIRCSKAMQDVGCYHLEKDDNIEKGCMGDLDEDTRDKYRTDKDVQICTTKNCNSMVVRQLKCAQCSNERDVNCAEPSESQKTKNCAGQSSSCLVGIDKKGATHRICGTTEQQANDKFDKYDLCYGDICNNDIFPKNRLKCLQCQGDSDCELKTPESKKKLQPKVCEIYNDKDECYTYYEDGGKVYRGCMTDQTNSRKSCEKNDQNCQKCDEAGCNDKSGAGNAQISLLLGITLTPIAIFRLLN